MINVQTVAVIGSGTMGAGIAEVAASHGHQVLLYDISAEALTRAIDGILARLNSRVTVKGQQQYSLLTADDQFAGGSLPATNAIDH